MKEFLIETFAHHRTLIVFLHVLSAVVWVGGMIAIRFATHQSLAMINDPKMRLERAAHTLKRLFAIVTPFVIVLIITAVFMAVGLGFRAAAVDSMGNVIDEYAISRSGASTLWELCAAQVPAFFIPFPHAAGDHQYHNAQYILQNDCGWCERQSDDLVEKLQKAILSDIRVKSEALASLIAPEGAVRIIEKIEAQNR